MGLSDEQKLKVLHLYLRGTEKYTEICEQLNLPYNAVNSFMTKWKARRGLTKKRKPRKPRVEDDLLPVPITITISELQELKFLRHFYKEFIKSQRKAS